MEQQKDDTIIIKAPQGTKTRWVRQSQSEGKKLSDWLREKVDGKAGPAIQEKSQKERT